jgi:hypothetical protein
MSEIIFIAVVASGPHRAAYPIEVGWCGLDLAPDGFLIRPAGDWSELDWSQESQLFHGLTRDQCIRDGVDVRDAALRLNALFADRIVFSDAPYPDAACLRALFGAADVEPRFTPLPRDATREIQERLELRGLGLWETELCLQRRITRTNRAPGDARYLAALWRCAHEDGFLEGLGETA